MSLCNRCLKECKVEHTNISACKNYHNPARREFDWRCRICNKKVPKKQQICLEHQAWINLLKSMFGIYGMFGTMSKLREVIRKYES